MTGETSNVTAYPCRFYPHLGCGRYYVSAYYRGLHERPIYSKFITINRLSGAHTEWRCKFDNIYFGLDNAGEEAVINHLATAHRDEILASIGGPTVTVQPTGTYVTRYVITCRFCGIKNSYATYDTAKAALYDHAKRYHPENYADIITGNIGSIVTVKDYRTGESIEVTKETVYPPIIEPSAPAPTTATVAGIVRGVLEDGTQVNLGGATVEVENLKSAVTGANGQYGLSGIPVGTHNWACSAPGYIPETGTVTVGVEHLGHQILLNILIRKPKAEVPIWEPSEENAAGELEPWLEQPIAAAGYGGVNLVVNTRVGPSLSPVVYINGAKVPYPVASSPNYSPVGSPYGTAVLQKSNSVKVTAVGYKDSVKQINFTDEQWNAINTVPHDVYKYVISLDPIPNSTYTIVPKLDTGQVLNVHVEIMMHDAGHNFQGRVEGTGPTGFEGYVLNAETHIMEGIISPPAGAISDQAVDINETIQWPAKITRNVIFKLKDPLTEPGPGPAQVYGQVRDFKTGIGIGDVRVLVESWGARPETRTAANGNWGFKDVPVGSYRISFNKGGYCEKLINVSVSGSDVFVGYVYMEPVVSLLGGDPDPQWRYGAKGYVRNSATHAGISGADVYLDGFHVQTDGNGFWSIQPGVIQPGDYKLTVKKAGYLDASATVPIPNTGTGGIFRFDVYMQPVSVPPTLPWADPKPPEIPIPGVEPQEPIRTPSEPVFEPDVTQPGQDRTGPDVVTPTEEKAWGFEFTSFVPEQMNVQTLLPVLVAIGIAAGAGTYYAVRKRRKR